MTTTHQSDDPYAAIGVFYDLEHNDFADDIPFYLNAIRFVGDPVLELGCGSGRLVRPIANAGHRITGLDRSANMLMRLHDSIRGARSEPFVTSYRGEMVEAQAAPGGPFGVVIFSLNGFMHLPTPEAQLAALRAARAALDPRGQLVIDTMNPTLVTLREYDGRVSHEGSWKSEEHGTIDKFAVRRLDATRQIVQTRLWYDASEPSGGALRRTVTEFELRYVYCHELQLMLAATGYVDWQFYGSYELDPLDDGSERMLVTAEVGAVD